MGRFTWASGTIRVKPADFEIRVGWSRIGAMTEPNPVHPAESGVEASPWFVRGRNAVVARADLTDLFVDYYLHLAKYRIQPDAGHDALFKDALAAFLLHCATRPR